MTLTYRELTPEEFPLAPREVPGSELFTPDNARILAAINEEGQVVATFTLFFAAHMEPMWIRDDYRHSASILRRMDGAMKALVRSMNIREAYTVVLNSTPVLHRFAKFFGCTPVDGQLYRWKE